jgi:hypothetical protein
MDIATIGRNHLRDALTGKMESCEVSEWKDADGQPVKLYWRPLTGAQQKAIQAQPTEVEQIAETLRQRALDADGTPAFRGVPLVSIINDYDFDVIRTVVFLITTSMGQDQAAEQQLESIEKE